VTHDRNIAVLWDMDGVIADTSKYHFQSWVIAFKPEGIKFTQIHFERAFGMANIDIIPMVSGKRVSIDKINAIADFKETTFRSLIKDKITALPGVIELVNSLKNAGIKMALVSSTPKENIDLILGKLGIMQYFDVIVSGDDVTEGKPSPQVYLLGAKKLSVAPHNCVVIEDAVVGVEAAKGGGMKCIGVTNTVPASKLSAADLIVDSLANVKIEMIEKLVN